MLTPKMCDRIVEMISTQFEEDGCPDAVVFGNGLTDYALRQIVAAYELAEFEESVDDYGIGDVLDALRLDLVMLNMNKPEEPGVEARHWAICITEMEKVFAYFNTFIAEGERGA